MALGSDYILFTSSSCLEFSSLVSKSVTPNKEGKRGSDRLGTLRAEF